MKLDDILSKAGRKKGRKRIGRGTGAGTGKTSGRGHKGANSRAGGTQRLGYEGGAIGTLQRIPKRGFNNANFRKEYQVVNVASLDAFDDGAIVDGQALEGARLIDDATKPIKVLGNGELAKKLTVKATKFSASAAKKIIEAGGIAESAEGPIVLTAEPEVEAPPVEADADVEADAEIEASIDKPAEASGTEEQAD